MSVATVTIKSAGKAMDDTYQMTSVTVTKGVNRIPTATIRLIDGDIATQEYSISDATFFEVGRLVTISLRYEGEPDHEVFKGIVVRQVVEADRNGSHLTVHLRDRAISLTRIRRSCVFADRTDAEIIAQIATDEGLTKGTLPATKPVHEEIVQYRCTDWDFIMSRADVNGLLVVVDGGEISTAPIEVTGSAVHRFEFGIDPIYEFEIELDGVSQVAGVESVAWDPTSQKATTAAQGKAPSFNRAGGKLAKDIGVGVVTLTNSTTMSPEELAAWASSRLSRSRMAMLRGRISVPGQGDVALLDVIEIAGIGTRFNATTIVTGLEHRLSSEGWVTEVLFGVSPATFASEPGIDEAGAAGLLPPVGGLQIGVVAEFADDPKEEYRVSVHVPGIGPKSGVVWARLAAPDAGQARGWFFRPEVGDEVVLGFVNDDPRHPIVLGSLFSSKSQPPEGMTVEDKNLSKGIVTRGGTKLIFTDDEKPSFQIETAAGNSVALDDEAKQVVVTDQHGNTITLSQDGIEISSAKDLVLSAAGHVKIGADSNVEIKGKKVNIT